MEKSGEMLLPSLLFHYYYSYLAAPPILIYRYLFFRHRFLLCDEVTGDISLTSAKMTFTSDDKLQWEVRKLQTEVHNLSRPFTRQPTFWLGAVTLAASIGWNVMQYSTAEGRKVLAEVQKTRLEIEAANLAAKKVALQQEVDTLFATINAHGEAIAATTGRLQQRVQQIESKSRTAAEARDSISRELALLKTQAQELRGAAGSATRQLAASGVPQETLRPRDTEAAVRFEGQAFEALVQRNYDEAQKLFQASEDASNGFRFSYEWSRLLRTRKDELTTEEGRREVLDFALAKGYASYAPSELRKALREQLKQ